MSSFPPDLEAYVDSKLQSGAFSSRDDLTTEALRLYRHWDEQRQQLKADIDAAREQFDRGEFAEWDPEAIKQELIGELDEQGNPR